MAVLYGRRLEVEVAGLNIKDLRINVELERQIDKTQDKGHVLIYNLRPAHEQQIEDRGRAIRVLAGYPQTTAILFEGQVQHVLRAREHLSQITRVDIGDRVRQKDRLGGVYFASFDGPVNIREIAYHIIVVTLGLPIGPLDAIPATATFTDFYWAGGSAVNALDVLLKRVDCYWFEADGVIRVNKVGLSQVDAPTIVITPETGMIDTPIKTDEGAEVRTFLNARIVLGCVIELKSIALTGRWKVVGLRHSADNWEGNFETFCDLRAL